MHLNVTQPTTACGRTKTTSIVKCLAKDQKKTIADHLQKSPFVIGTDGSQEGGDKMFGPPTSKLLSCLAVLLEVLHKHY